MGQQIAGFTWHFQANFKNKEIGRASSGSRSADFLAIVGGTLAEDCVGLGGQEI